MSHCSAAALAGRREIGVGQGAPAGAAARLALVRRTIAFTDRCATHEPPF